MGEVVRLPSFLLTKIFCLGKNHNTQAQNYIEVTLEEILESLVKRGLIYRRKSLIYQDKQIDKDKLYTILISLMDASKDEGWFEYFFVNADTIKQKKIVEKLLIEAKKYFVEKTSAREKCEYEFVYVMNYKDVGLKYHDGYCLYDTKTETLKKDIAPSSFPVTYQAAKDLHSTGNLKRFEVIYERTYGERVVKKEDYDNLYIYNEYIKPAYLDCKRNRDHIETITSFIKELIPETESRTVFYDWWALSLFKKAPVYLLLVGKQGIGKSLLCKLVSALHGDENTTILGNDFGGHRFLAQVRTAYLGIGEEIYTTKDESKERMKALVEDYIYLEKKGVDAKKHKNITSFILNSNKYNCVPWDGETDRKFCVLDISKTPVKKSTIKDFAKILGLNNNEPHLPTLHTIHDLLLKRYKAGIKSDFTDTFRSKTYEKCVLERVGIGKRYLVEFLFNRAKGCKNLDILEKPKGIISIAEIMEFFVQEHHSRQRNGYPLQVENARSFLQSFCINKEPIVEFLENGDMKILQGPLKYENEELTWTDFMEQQK